MYSQRRDVPRRWSAIDAVFGKQELVAGKLLQVGRGRQAFDA